MVFAICKFKNHIIKLGTSFGYFHSDGKLLLKSLFYLIFLKIKINYLKSYPQMPFDHPNGSFSTSSFVKTFPCDKNSANCATIEPGPHDDIAITFPS